MSPVNGPSPGTTTALGRKLLCRGVRFVLNAPGAGPLRRAAERVPFSRFHRLASWLFWGREAIRWRGVRVIVNPGEVHGYYAYFLDYASEEITR